MQEPIEPMEDLQPIDHISINDGELSFEMLISNMISKLFLATYLSVFLKERSVHLLGRRVQVKVQYLT